MRNPIYVTMPTLAPLEEVNELMKGIWESGIMTHNGPLVQRFEKEVCEHLGVPQMVSCCNGTLALQMAIKALGRTGEIITSPLRSLLLSVPLCGSNVRQCLWILIRRL